MDIATLVLRALVYASGFIGAGWFGYWVYENGWTTPLSIIAVVGGLVGVLVAGLVTTLQWEKERRAARRPSQ